MGRRQQATEQTRARILTAARELLVAGGFSGFTIDAVARQAGVARMTVYYQFGSKVGMLEALSDDLAQRGQMDLLPAAFAQPDPRDALDAFIAAFARFWTTDRLVVRRLRALAALDADFEQVVRGRDEWRRHGARVILGRLSERYGHPPAEALDEASDSVYTLTSFETFDTLAGPTRTPEDVAPLVMRLVHAVVGLDT
jgi:AcrR family transcriptional regulator